jgi:hypothetical protein
VSIAQRFGKAGVPGISKRRRFSPVRPGPTLARSLRMRTAGTIALAAAAVLMLIAPRIVRSEEIGQTLRSCPGYADHLRNARQYLERSDRASAVRELKRAREALESCSGAQASETAIAASAPQVHES